MTWCNNPGCLILLQRGIPSAHSQSDPFGSFLHARFLPGHCDQFLKLREQTVGAESALGPMRIPFSVINVRWSDPGLTPVGSSLTPV